MSAEEAATTYSKQSGGFHPNGQQRSELNIKKNMRHGLDISWDEPRLKEWKASTRMIREKDYGFIGIVTEEYESKGHTRMGKIMERLSVSIKTLRKGERVDTYEEFTEKSGIAQSLTAITFEIPIILPQESSRNPNWQ